MILDIFDDIGDGINKIYEKFGGIVNDNFDNPIFWWALFFGLLLFACYYISNNANK